MARSKGVIGFVLETEDRPGVVVEKITEREYRFTTSRQDISFVDGQQINESMQLSNVLTIVADSFAIENIGVMKYAIVNKSKWKINSVEIVNRPNITIRLGGIYK